MYNGLPNHVGSVELGRDFSIAVGNTINISALWDCADSYRLKLVFLRADQPAPVRTMDDPDERLCVRVDHRNKVTELFYPEAPVFKRPYVLQHRRAMVHTP